MFVGKTTSLLNKVLIHYRDEGLRHTIGLGLRKIASKLIEPTQATTAVQAVEAKSAPPQPGGQHSNDLPDELYEKLKERVPEQDLLETIRTLSREHFGFFTKHPSRTLEYVWLAQQIPTPGGKRILDIGAGVNPMPIYFALLGAEVITLDNSPLNRQREDQELWNEWGYLDYQPYHPSISSFNQDIDGFELPSDSLDVIYSISVLEHIPAAERRQLWPQLAAFIRKGGPLLLTFDLYAGSDDLWNFAAGEEVEPRTAHGNLRAILAEIEGNFTLVSSEVVGEIPGLAAVDIALMLFRRC